ncbi:MAG: hypothetical protein AAGB28_17965, partial [Pseudomonadota bacterium]
MIRRISFGLVALSLLGTVAATSAWSQGKGLAGSYLAARAATFESDFRAASDYYVRALVRDPANQELMEDAITALVAVGRVNRAVPIARQLTTLGGISPAASQVLIADSVSRENYDGLIEDLDAGMSVGPLVDKLLAAWSQVGAGRMADALSLFDEVTEEPGLSAFGNYHKALALASVGDFEGALAIFEAGDAQQLQNTRRG